MQYHGKVVYVGGFPYILGVGAKAALIEAKGSTPCDLGTIYSEDDWANAGRDLSGLEGMLVTVIGCSTMLNNTVPVVAYSDVIPGGDTGVVGK